MRLKDIALNNLRRRKSKMLFLIFGMVFAITTIVALYSITSAMKNEVLKKYNEAGTQLVITPDNNAKTISYGGITVPNVKVVYNIKELKDTAPEQLKKVKDADKILAVAPKVLGAAEVNNKKLTLVGVNFQSETKIKSYWHVVGRYPENDNEVVIGSDVAGILNKKTGDTLNIRGNNFKIVGTLEQTGSEEDKLLFANLPGVQKTFNKEGMLSFIEISVAKDNTAVQNITSEIKRILPEAKVSSPQQAVEQRKETVDRFAQFSLIISLIMVLIGALIVMTTMISSVNDRTREIGIFRAIGFRKSHVIKIIMLEAGITCGLSGVIGWVVGYMIALYIAPIVAQMKVSVDINPLFAMSVIILSIAVGLLATLYPASKASKLDPAESLRFI